MLSQLLLIFYFSLVGIYSLYGYVEIISQRFCWESRPGRILNDQNLDVNGFIHLSDGTIIEALNNTLRIFGEPKNLSRIEKVQLNNGLYQNLTCHYKRMAGFSHDGSQLTNYTQMKTGFLANNIDLSDRFNYLVCTFQTYEEDCTTTVRTKNSFLFATLVCIVCLVLLILLSSRLFRFYYIRFLFQNVLQFFGIDIPRTHKSCNPLTDKSHYICKGSKILKLGNYENVCLETSDFGIWGNRYIAIHNDNLNFFNGNNVVSFKLNQHVKKEMGKIIKIVQSDPTFWPTNMEETHYYDIETLIQFLNSGCFVDFTSKNKSGLINEDDFLVKFLKLELECKLNLCRAIIFHNHKFFFKSKGNTPAMHLVASGKTSWFDRPRNIGNKQWKLYTSDLFHFFKQKGLGKLFVQNKFEMTDSMKETIEKLDIGEFDRASEQDLQTEVTINLDNYILLKNTNEILAKNKRIIENSIIKTEKLIEIERDPIVFGLAESVNKAVSTDPFEVIKEGPFKRIQQEIPKIKTYMDALLQEKEQYSEEKMKEINKNHKKAQARYETWVKVKKITDEKDAYKSNLKFLFSAMEKSSIECPPMELHKHTDEILERVTKERDDIELVLDDMLIKKKRYLSNNSGPPVNKMYRNINIKKCKDSLLQNLDCNINLYNRFKVLESKEAMEESKISGVDLIKCMSKWNDRVGHLSINDRKELYISKEKRLKNGEMIKTKHKNPRSSKKNCKRADMKVKGRISFRKFAMNLSGNKIQECLEIIHKQNEELKSNTCGEIVMRKVQNKPVCTIPKDKNVNKMVYELIEHKIREYNKNKFGFSSQLNYIDQPLEKFRTSSEGAMIMEQGNSILKAINEVFKDFI